MKPLTIGLIGLGLYFFLNQKNNQVTINKVPLNPAENQEASTGGRGQVTSTGKVIAGNIKGEDQNGDYVITVYTDGTQSPKKYR